MAAAQVAALGQVPGDDVGQELAGRWLLGREERAGRPGVGHDLLVVSRGGSDRGRRLLHELLDRLLGVRGRDLGDVHGALAHLLLDVADRAARHARGLRLLDEAAHLGRQPVLALGLGADLLGAQLAEHHHHRLDVELVGLDHGLLVLVHHQRRHAPMPWLRAKRSTVLRASGRAISGTACSRSHASSVQTIGSVAMRGRLPTRPVIGHFVSTWPASAHQVLVVAFDLRRLQLLLGLDLGERQLLGRADAHDQLHVRRQQLGIASSSHLLVTVALSPFVRSITNSSTARRAIPSANGGTRRMRTSASGAHCRPALPSSSIQGMSSGRMPLVPTMQQVAGREAHQVLGLRAHVGAVDAVGAVARGDEQRGLDLLRPLQDHLEGLADQDLRLHLDVGVLLGHRLGALDVRLAELQQALVDDVVVQLLLLLELEDLRGLHRQHVLDVVEHDVVVLDVERAADVERRAEVLRQLERHASCRGSSRRSRRRRP